MPGNYINVKPPLFATNPAALREREHLVFIPFLANYEVDIWGKNRANTKAQKEQQTATEQDSRTVYISLTTDTASAYFNILQLDKLIELQNGIILTDTESLTITNSEFENGLTSFDDVATAEFNLEQSRTLLNDLCRDRDFFLNELMVLTGRTPVEGDKELLTRSSIDKIHLPTGTPMEIPSTGVMQRPDILKAEANLRYSKINIDVARKAFLPKVTIFGALGIEAINVGNLTDIDEMLTAFGTLFSEDLFTGGQRHAVLKQKKLQYEQMLENYQSTILNALKETNNALYSLKTDIQNSESTLKQIKLQSDNLNLTNVRYTQGLSSRLETVQPQKSLILSCQEHVRSKTSYLIDSLNLYKALGGEI